VYVLAHDIKKARAGVFEEVPTIGDLYRWGAPLDAASL
jgi:hypothetical protein